MSVMSLRSTGVTHTALVTVLTFQLRIEVTDVPWFLHFDLGIACCSSCPRLQSPPVEYEMSRCVLVTVEFCAASRSTGNRVFLDRLKCVFAPVTSVDEWS